MHEKAQYENVLCETRATPRRYYLINLLNSSFRRWITIRNVLRLHRDANKAHLYLLHELCQQYVITFKLIKALLLLLQLTSLNKRTVNAALHVAPYGLRAGYFCTKAKLNKNRVNKTFS